jgi:hypothetical protein
LKKILPGRKPLDTRDLCWKEPRKFQAVAQQASLQLTDGCFHQATLSDVLALFFGIFQTDLLMAEQKIS